MYKCIQRASRPSGLPEEVCATPPSRLFSAKKDASDPSRQSQGRRRRKSHQSSRLSALVLLVRRSVSALLLLWTLSWYPVTWDGRPQRIHTRVHTDGSGLISRQGLGGLRSASAAVWRVRHVTRSLAPPRRERGGTRTVRTRATGLSCAHGKPPRLTDRRSNAR